MMSASLFRAMLLASALGCAGPSFAQQTHNDDAESELDAVVEPPKAPPVKVEPAGAADLRDAIRRIAVRPNDSYALTDAVKANTLQPSDARIKSGLAQALVRKENPFEALRYFDEAQRLGASERSFALDRALAYDLLGNFERAQQDYQLARTFGTSDETITRHAISLSLSGKASEADVMLGPLLDRDNMEAWRARSFMLAARGDTREAGKIAAAFMPEAEVRRLDYYFRQMPKLTPAQQAAALHFGHFPTNGNAFWYTAWTEAGPQRQQARRSQSQSCEGPERTAQSCSCEERIV
jgi:Flp pilus assembly protein TadD